AVIRGQHQSRWLRSFLSAKRRRVVNIYLEDDQQLDQVYWYLNELYGKAAIIYAIAGVDNLSVKKAEEKYLKGRCISNRLFHFSYIPGKIWTEPSYKSVESGLLVGLEETRGSVVCLYELGLSRVVKAVVIPGRVVTKSPADIPRLREVSTREGRHLCLQLNPPGSVGVTALQYISRTNQLAVGFSDGHLQLEGDLVCLHLLQLAFSERKCLASGKILYENCPYLAVWSLDSVVQMVSPYTFLDVVVHERSLSRGLPFTCPPPEQYFNPTTYNFGAPLFNSSSNFTDPQTLQLLQHTQKLLNEDALQIPRPFFTHSVISNYYTIRREELIRLAKCLIEAWCLLRQHSNRLNITELLGFLYESCQELGLIKELLKLPLGLNEQSERDPKLKERSNTRNSILDQYGKVLPRVQRKLAMERVKPYQHPSTIHKEGRSITPPLRSKESRITFIEEAETVEIEKGIRWINGDVAAVANPSAGGQTHVNVNFDTSQTSVLSTDTSLEYYDATLSEDPKGARGPMVAEDDDDDVVTLNIKPVTENEPEQRSDITIEQSFNLPSEDADKEEEFLKEAEPCEEVTEGASDQKVYEEERAESRREEYLNPVSMSKQDDIASPEQEERSPLQEATNQAAQDQLQTAEPTGTDSHCEEEYIPSQIYSCSGILVKYADFSVCALLAVGNGRLPPLQPSSAFMQQEHAHFLQDLSEQQAAEFSLITPEQRSPYMELKPSTTLLVPFEFMEGQQDLVDGAHFALPELQPSVVGDEQQPETHTGFTLMLDTDEDGVTEALAAGNDLQMSELPAQPQIQSENLLDKCDVITLDTDNIEEAAQEEERKEIENLDQNDVYVVGEEEHGNDQADLQTEFTAAKQETDDSAKQKDLKLEEIRIFSEDEESAAVSVPGEPLAAVNDTDSTAKTEAVEEEVSEEDKTMPAEEVQLPEGNGAVDTEMEKTESAVEDKKHDHITSSETEARSEEETEEKPRRILRHRNVKEELVEQVVSSDSQTEKETVASQRKKAPSTPTRRMTRGRNVTFISPLPEAADEREQDGNAEFDKQSIAVPATATRTSRKGKPLQTATPRRSTRKTQPDLSKEEAEGMDNEISLASTSKTPSPGRRSQRATATRTSIKDKSLTTEVEIKEDSQEDEVVKTTRSRRTSSKTPTPSKRSTTQTGTPRRSSRKTVNTSEVEPTPLEAVKEENKEVPVVPPVKRSSRKMRPEVLPAVFEEDEKKQQLSSPGRTTRQFSLNVYPQVRIQP
ncbi:hypothetical protein XENOCAPTIV_007391, partial [Xenoophorus captivus]